MNIAQKLMDHRFAGLCPDAVDGWDRRDPGCPACRALDALAEQGTEEWAVRLNADETSYVVCRSEQDAWDERAYMLDMFPDAVVMRRTVPAPTPWLPVEEPNRPDGSTDDA